MELDYIAKVPMEQGLANLPVKCADLVIADPPFYRVKGDFDFKFKDWNEYVGRVAVWRDAIHRVLKPSGSLVWWGFHLTIGKIQVLLEEKFRILNSCVVVKDNDIQNCLQSKDISRKFISNSERFLFMEPIQPSPSDEAENVFRRQKGFQRSRMLKPVIDILNKARIEAGFSICDVGRELLTGMASHWFTYKSQFQMPTREWYFKLQNLFGDRLKMGYDEIRRIHDNTLLVKSGFDVDEDCGRRYFAMGEERLSDVFFEKSKSAEAVRFQHPTVKPYGLTKEIIKATTRPGNLVVVPFAGSGTECAASKELGRHWIGFETNGDYCTIANERLAKTVGVSMAH